MLFRYYFILFICLLFFSNPSTAQVENKLLLKQITTLQGLSNSNISVVFEDSRGFLWVGTHDGLDRYDGKNITVFRKNLNDTNSLINDWVTGIEEDKHGNLWIGTGGGLSKLNVLNATFENYNSTQLFTGRQVLAGEQKVFRDKQDRIWVCSGGLSYYDEENDRFIVQPSIPPTKEHGVSKNQLVTNVRIDAGGNFWMGTFDGLYEYNVAAKTYTRYQDSINADLYKKQGDLFGFSLVLNDHQLLAASWVEAMYLISKGDSEMQRIPLHGLVDIIPFRVNWQGQEEYWIAHIGGILRMDANFKVITDWRSKEGGFPDYINCIYQSKQGIIFIGTTEGLVILNPYAQVFKTYYFKGGDEFLTKDAGLIGSIFFYKNNLFAGGLYSNALYVLNDKFQLIHNIKTFAPLSPTESNAQTCDMKLDTSQNAWLATFQGLIKLNPSSLSYTAYLPDKNDSLFFRHKRFDAVTEDKTGKIWLANYKQDLLSFDTAANRFTVYRPFAHSQNIEDVMATRQGEVWFTSGNILLKYDSRRNNFLQYTTKLAKDVLFGTLIEGKENELWITSFDGIWRYNINTQQWKNWNTNDGLCNNRVNNLLFDKRGRLWILTSTGISAFDTAQNIFYSYTKQDGLPYDEWNGAASLDDKGNIYLGNTNTITFFNPDEAALPSQNYPAYITAFRVNGNPYSVHSSDPVKKITLAYDQNNLNFQFTVVNFLQPFQTTYYYKLEGFDTNWHLSSNGNINYTNLDAGRYVLKVTGNPNSSDISKNDSVIIIIQRPFWETWWFILSVAILFGGTITLIIGNRINNIRREAERRSAISQQFADLRMKALRSQMNPHFLFNSLNAIQECCLTGQIDTATQYLARFSKLVRAILENSDKQWISLQEEINILKLYMDVESLRFANSFHYETEIKTHTSPAMIKIPPMLVQPFVENAIWHGLLQKNGQRNLWLRFSSNEEMLLIEIEDNGVGRAATQKEGHHSMGTSIVDERMKLIEELQRSATTMEIIDKKDEHGNATGTLVKLKIPML